MAIGCLVRLECRLRGYLMSVRRYPGQAQHLNHDFINVRLQAESKLSGRNGPEAVAPVKFALEVVYDVGTGLRRFSC